MPAGRCEIYFFPGGYGGVNFVEGGVANHCFLIRADAVKEYGSDADKIVNELVFTNSRAMETLKNAKKEFDWLAVAVDGFGPKDLTPAPNLFAVGDAGAFIDPFTGSGMLMALESSALLANVLIQNPSSRSAAANRYSAEHKASFSRRLRLCSVMRLISFSPLFAGAAVTAVGLSSSVRKLIARSTRRGAKAGGL
jgi:flavin-dependent dehydrogenase